MSWTYSEKDVILYALSIGCTWDEARFVYENDENFASLPTFGVLALHKEGALDSIDFGKLVPNYNPMLLLHGEQFLELHKPLPTSGKLVTTSRVIDLIDKGKAALLILGLTTKDAESGEVILENEASIFLRGSGGFGKARVKERKAAAIAQNTPPQRAPDVVTKEQTDTNLAALYRLNGDSNPLHIDPPFAAAAGFQRPILHGLCTFGISAKHVIKAFGLSHSRTMRSIKGRFAKHIFPGETLQTEMWVQGNDTIIFQSKAIERNEVVISNAAVMFEDQALQTLSHSRL